MSLISFHELRIAVHFMWHSWCTTEKTGNVFGILSTCLFIASYSIYSLKKLPEAKKSGLRSREYNLNTDYCVFT